ncbi:hypothetical protein PQR08_34490, partial [Caballeronia jiangsuensis]
QCFSHVRPLPNLIDDSRVVDARHGRDSSSLIRLEKRPAMSLGISFLPAHCAIAVFCRAIDILSNIYLVFLKYL